MASPFLTLAPRPSVASTALQPLIDRASPVAVIYVYTLIIRICIEIVRSSRRIHVARAEKPPPIDFPCQNSREIYQNSDRHLVRGLTADYRVRTRRGASISFRTLAL